MSKPAEDIATRLWRKVTKTESCWNWTGYRDCFGYGRITCNIDGRRRAIPAHRVAWIITNGPVTPDICILHRCDNPACINPSHLFPGTRADNVADMDAKSRRRVTTKRGTAHHWTKLTEEDVIAIRRRAANGETCKAIAADYGIHLSAVSNIALRKCWKHVT